MKNWLISFAFGFMVCFVLPAVPAYAQAALEPVRWDTIWLMPDGDFSLEFSVPKKLSGQVNYDVHTGKLMIAVNKNESKDDAYRHVMRWAINGESKVPGKEEWLIWDEGIKVENGGPQWVFMHTYPNDKHYLNDFLRLIPTLKSAEVQEKIKKWFAKELANLSK